MAVPPPVVGDVKAVSSINTFVLSTVTLKYSAFSFFVSSLGGERNECARVKTASHKEGDMRANESNSTSSYIRKFFVFSTASVKMVNLLQLVMQGFCEFC